MQWHVDSPTELTSVDPEQVDLSLGGGDEDVVFARMIVKACNFAIVDEELRKRRHVHSVVLNFNKLKTDAVGCSN